MPGLTSYTPETISPSSRRGGSALATAGAAQLGMPSLVGSAVCAAFFTSSADTQLLVPFSVTQLAAASWDRMPGFVVLSGFLVSSSWVPALICTLPTRLADDTILVAAASPDMCVFIT